MERGLMKIPSPLEYPIYYLGALIFAAGIGYQLFLLVDGQWLSRREAPGMVMSKEYRPVGRSTFTTKVGNTVRSYPVTVPDAYLVTVEVEGRRGTGEVPRSEYDELKEGDAVQVAYSRRRIRGTLSILAIAKPGGTP
jgi:hypothetical protein